MYKRWVDLIREKEFSNGLKYFQNASQDECKSLSCKLGFAFGKWIEDNNHTKSITIGMIRSATYDAIDLVQTAALDGCFNDILEDHNMEFK